MGGETTFGPFELDGRHGTIHRDGKRVAVTSRGFVLFQVLADARGRAVSKSELMEAAWPQTVVEESNLTVQMASLRKALGRAPSGEEWIVTIPRVGYRLINLAADSSNPLPTSTDKPSIAVLPFNNLGSDPQQEYFAVGLAEDLITDLSKIPGLLVIARNSSFAYKAPGDVRAVAKELGVRYLVQGSVRRSINRVRINAELIDSTDNGHLWADRFDRDLADIFALQDEIAGRIVNALSSVLPREEPVFRPRASSLEACDLFARARALVNESAENNKAARLLLAESIRLDPGFADAYAWLAMSYTFGWVLWHETVEPDWSLVLTTAQRAITLDPQNAGARAVLGDVLLFQGRTREAVSELTTALEMDANQADAWVFLGEARVYEGNAVEGIDLTRKALRLNPHPPGWYYWYLGFAQYAAGRYEDAVATLSHASTRRLASQRILAASLAQLGRLDEAKTAAAQFLAAHPTFTVTLWARTQPFLNEADRQPFIEGYLKAGLPP